VTIELDHVEKTLRRLRKLLADFPGNPRPEEVHALRIQSRRLEAIISALLPDLSGDPGRLLKIISPVRAAAGAVRDMDVLIGELLALSKPLAGDALVRLVEHLSKMRAKRARKLQSVIVKRRKEARKRINRCSMLIKEKVRKDTAGALNGTVAPGLLLNELSHWPNLEAGNLHQFRIRVKELRYMLQLDSGTDPEWIDGLGEVKNSIGEWHDWMELLKIANKVLDPKFDGALLKQIEKGGKTKLHFALAAANSMRLQYFSTGAGRGVQSSRRQRPQTS
jgi:CHAD domain-containing protein